MPKISSTSPTRSAALPSVSLLASPTAAPADPSGRFKQALADAVKPKPPKAIDPHSSKKTGKSLKPAKVDAGESHAAASEKPDDVSHDSSQDDATAHDLENEAAPQDSNGKSVTAVSKPKTATSQTADADVQADASIASEAVSSATSSVEPAAVALPDETSTVVEAADKKPTKATGSPSTVDPSDIQLLQTSPTGAGPSISPAQSEDVTATSPQPDSSAIVNSQAASKPDAAKTPPLAPAIKPTSSAQIADSETPAADEGAEDYSDSNPATADVSDADPPTSESSTSSAKTTRTPSSTAKKTSLTPGEIPPLPQDPSLQPSNAAAANAALPQLNPTSTNSDAVSKAIEVIDTDASTDRPAAKADADLPLDASQLLATDKPAVHASTTNFATHLAATATPAEVASNNHDKIVQVVRSDLTPGGGTMKIRLDPPELGALQVTVKMSDGVMTASFETSSDQATKMLSHSLGQLKAALESSGVSVEKLHVQQAPKDSSSDSSGGKEESRREQMRGSDDSSQQQRDQQRKEMIRRMWAKLGVGDPLDLVA